MPKLANKRIGFCPECGADVRLRKAPHLGQRVSCHNCGSALEVVSRDPIELDWAVEEPFDEEEDDYLYEVEPDRYNRYDSRY